MTDSMCAIGLMSGTSMDGIDVAYIETDGEKIFKRGPGVTHPYSDAARAMITAATADAESMKGRHSRSKKLTEAEQAITRSHAQAVKDFVAANNIPPGGVNVIGFHGQTVLHRPDKGLSIQLGDGQLLADLTGIDVVYDLRARDLISGGQGAPLAPVYHKALARHSGLEPPLAVVNIGGVSNITWIGANGEIIAFDTGPGNVLIDEWAHRHTGETMDQDGQLARHGKVDEIAVAAFFQHEFFGKSPPKSLDRKDFSLFLFEGMGIWDAAATLTAITAEAIARSVSYLPQPPKQWVISGGGAHNPELMTALKNRLKGRVDTARNVGWSAAFMEAEAFGFLAVRSVRALPLTFPETTGVPEPVTGGIAASPAAAV